MFLPSIRKKALLLPRSVDYFAGVALSRAPLPDHLLFFHRRDRAPLVKLRNSLDHHHRFVLVASLLTDGSLEVDGKAIRLCPGQVLLIFPYQFHRYLEFADETINWLFMTFEMEDAEAIEPLRNISLALSPKGLRILDEALGIYLNTVDEPNAIDNRIPLLGSLLLQEMLASRQLKGPEVKPLERFEAQTQQFTERIHRYIFQHLKDEFSVSDMAAALKVSHSHLRREFRRQMGTSVGRYVRECRLKRACGLIHNSGMSLSEIAAACGFDSIYSFSRAFKRLHGIAPHEYRVRSRNPKPFFEHPAPRRSLNYELMGSGEKVGRE